MTQPTFITVKTRRINPPQDNFVDALKEALPSVKEGDVICISAKVVAIHEGRCVKGEKDDFVEKETNWWLPRENNAYGFRLSIIHHALIASAGIDKSNSGDYLTLLPKDPTASAKYFHKIIKEKYNVKKIAVIITDSHSTPLRQGTTGVAIGAYGVETIKDYRGKKDLFGHTLQISRSNMIDPIASAAVNLMGEGNEQTPIVIVRNWPNLIFVQKDTWQDLTIDPEDDVYWHMLKIFKRT